MAIEFTLLGLLRREPRHGYDLAKEFAPGTTLGEIVHLEPGMLYAYLKKLESAGHVHAVVETQGARPPRRVFALTPAGDHALDDWLAAPVEHTRDLRLEFLLKLAIARDDAPELATRLIAEQHGVCARFVDNLTEQLAAEPDDFRKLVIEMRIAQNRALLDWLASARERVVA